MQDAGEENKGKQGILEEDGNDENGAAELRRKLHPSSNEREKKVTACEEQRENEVRTSKGAVELRRKLRRTIA